MTATKDMSFLPRVVDTPGVSFTWQQGPEPGDDSLSVSIYFHEIEAETAKSTDFEISVADEEIIIVKHKGTKLVQWRLTDALAQSEDPIEWILNRNTKPLSVEVTLRKKEDNDWPCLRKQPLIAVEKPDELILSEATLNEYVGYEVPSLPLETKEGDDVAPAAAATATAESAEGEGEGETKKETEGEDQGSAAEPDKKEATEGEVEEKKTEGEEDKKKQEAEQEDVDIDALLEEVAEEMTANNNKKEGGDDKGKKEGDEVKGDDEKSLEALMKMRRERESAAYVAEFEALERAQEDNKAKLDSEDEAVVKDAKENIQLIQKMREIIIEKRHVRTLPVSIDNLIKVLQLEIKKIITNSGNEKGEEDEDYANDDERAMTGEQLFKKGLDEVKAQTKDSLVSAFHFLRLASLKFNHPIATMVLHRMYTQFRAPTKGAFFLLRLALQPEVDRKSNRSVGELIDSGVHPFTAIFSLAVHFLQRAAKEGDAQAMMRLSNLYYDGICHVQRQMVVHPDVRKKFTQTKRAEAFLQAALDRGLSEAYLMKASMHLRGENGHEKSPELAKKYFDLVKMCDHEAAVRLAPMFEPKPASPSTPNGGSSNFGAGLRGAFNKPNTSSSSNNNTNQQQQQQQSRGGALISQNSNNNNNNNSARPGMDRLQALSQRSGGDAGSGMAMMPSVGGGAGPRGGMMSGGGGGAGGPVSPWQKRFESLARFGAGAYFLYIAAFPVRLMVLPYFYEFVGGVLSIFGGGGSGRNRNNMRSMQGGMF